MTTPSVDFNTVAAQAASTSAPSTSSAGDIPLDKNAFLQMLVAQMKYQNPLSPTDGTQYMSQMAQFATVEQLDNIAKAQTEANTWQLALNGENMVGKYVSGKNSSGSDVTGLVKALQITSTGALLTLDNGLTLSVSNVDKVGATADSIAAPQTPNTTTSGS